MSDDGCSCKIGRNARTYGLSLDRELRQRHERGESLRALARIHNQRLLAAALADVNAAIVGDVDAIYGKLTDEDVSAGTRAEVRAQLSNAGIDVDALLDDFVSHQTVRTHLRNCADVDTSRSGDLTTDRARSIVEWARSRSEAVIERTVRRLGESDDFARSSLSVTQSVRVTCDDCGETYRLGEFLDQGGCDCTASAVLDDDVSSDPREDSS